MAKRAPSELDELRDLIRAHQLRATPARLAVLELVRRSSSPLTHGEICGRLVGPHDRATIYRALNQLAEARLIRRIDLGDHVWRFDAGDRHRADFVCRGCGAVIDITGVDVSGGSAPRSVASGQIEIRLIGLCDDCG